LLSEAVVVCVVGAEASPNPPFSSVFCCSVHESVLAQIEAQIATGSGETGLQPSPSLCGQFQLSEC